jgi:predicted acyltransferase (DUF342 family)
MAVNKNFVVKNGLEVDTNTLFVDSANNRVAIGTTVPTTTLDVRGKILSDSQVESWVGKFVGIVTAGAVGVTTMTATDAVVTGFSTLGKANATSLNVTTGFSTVQSLTATDLTVSIGATVTKDLNVGAAATIGAALTVTGNAYLNGDVDINKALDVGEDLNVGAAATVGSALTVTGGAKIALDSRFEKALEIGEDLNVGGATTISGPTILSSDLNVSGASTVGGALTVTGNAYFNGNVDINGDLSYDEVNARNINISGIATLGFATAGNAYVSGITTSSLLHVGMGATMIKVEGIPATRVGINSVGPAFTLDVDGDSNVTGTVLQGGVSVITTASGDATALAIALG